MSNAALADNELTQQERHTLMDYLAQPGRAEDCLQYDDVLGFINGVSCAPDVVLPQEWIATIFAQDELDLGDLDDPAVIINPLMKLYTQALKDHLEGNFSFPAEYATLTGEDLDEALSGWIEGFLCAFDWLQESWAEALEETPLINADGEELDTRHLIMSSLALIAMYFDPDAWEENEVDETFFTPERLQDYIATVGGVGQYLYEVYAGKQKELEGEPAPE